MPKRWFIALLVPLLLGAAEAGPVLSGAAGPRTGEMQVVTVRLAKEAALERLQRAGFNISSRHGSTVEIYATHEEVQRLRDLGFEPVPVEQTKVDAEDLAGYHDYAEVTGLLQAFASEYPDISRLSSLGRSVQGRELWALLITDNPDVEEAEPEFKYVSTIHGDEPVGTEMTLLFIDRLLRDYGVDARITGLVDETAIWIVPLMNPDGLENNTRFNAQGVDLNRSFPHYGDDFTGTWFDGGDLSLAGRPLEVQRVMNWTLSNSFVLSANYHTGSVVVNYPYDYDSVPSGTYAACPDDALFREISLRYAEHNMPMYMSTEFPHGITNGSDWYSITGGMQDWNYRYAGVNEVTIEIATPKRPSGALLPQYWADNEESMLSYLESVHMGVHGLVTDDDGMAVWAQVTIAGNPQPVFTDPDVGDYYRMALPGTYNLVFSAEGYIEKTTTNVAVAADQPTRLDVVLLDGDIDDDGVVGATDVQWAINATLGMNVPYECDVDGGGVTATDVQKIVNVVLAAAG